MFLGPIVDSASAPPEAGSGGEEPRTLLVAQITDIHIGFDPDDDDELNLQRLAAALDRLAALDRPPDLLFATGDLVDRGDKASYRRLKAALAGVGCPVHLAMGNHDARYAFRAVFPDVPVTAEGHVQYAVDAGPLRFVVLDTLEEGRHGGAFCEARAAWLAATLAEAPERPTVLVLHHPPVDTGIAWMTTDPAEPWVARLEAAVAGHGQLVGAIAGHIHRPLVTGWAGLPLAICPSTAPQVALTLSAMDPERPDGRAMIVADQPALALHWWNGRGLVTHYTDAGAPPVLASFTPALQPLVRGMMAERPA